MTNTDDEHKHEPNHLIPFGPASLGTPAERGQALSKLYDTTQDARDTIAVLWEELLASYRTRLERLGLTVEDLENAPFDAKELADRIGKDLFAYLHENPTLANNPKEKSSLAGLYHLAATIGVALRLTPTIALNSSAQTVISHGLLSANNLADCISDRFYLGREIEGEGRLVEEIHATNALIQTYFDHMPFKPGLEQLRAIPTPISLVLTDWNATVEYCKRHGVPSTAFLNDGTPLFKFAPDALPYVYSNRERFSGLDLLLVNDGAHVNGWLQGAKLGREAGQISHDDWLVLLTGYKPEDNQAIPLLYQRYNEPLISTALDLGNKR
ncbi:MAG: hypothetical protein AABX70_02160 [Nanoarchaeota archaeon]